MDVMILVLLLLLLLLLLPMMNLARGIRPTSHSDVLVASDVQAKTSQDKSIQVVANAHLIVRS